MAPRPCPELLSTVPKHMEKTRLLDRLRSNMNCNIVGREFNVNESINKIY